MDFRVFECGTAYRKNDLAPALICLEFRVNEGTEITLTSHDFKFTAPDGKALGIGNFKGTSTVFLGGREANAPPIARALSDAENWKRYLLNIEVPPFSSTNFIMSMPELRINGKAFPQFEFMFQRVTEDVCYLSV